MDNDWHYSETGDQSRGPVSIENLGRILAAESNSENFLVWSPGMSGWARAGDLAALKQYFSQRAHPPLAGSPSDATAATTSATSTNLHPWRRYFARMIDLYLFILIFFFFLGIVFPELFDEDEVAENSRASELLYSIIWIAAYCVFETFCLNVFGGTIGKFLYGIRLAPKEGQQIAFSVALKRSLAVWFRGMGLAIPIVAVFTLVIAYSTLTEEGQTRWDRDYKIVVLHRDLSILRWLVVGIAWLLVSSIYVALIAASKS